MSSAAPPPRLRLVGADGAFDVAAWAAERRRRQEVIGENRSAARNAALEPTDPRWVLAVRAAAQLEGSMLTPERRERVMRTAALLGVRPFDAALIIAIVQDHARRGQDLGAAGATLALLSPPHPRRTGMPAWLRWAAAIASAIVADALLVWWLLFGR